jgi:hypothetical protein
MNFNIHLALIAAALATLSAAVPVTNIAAADPATIEKRYKLPWNCVRVPVSSQTQNLSGIAEATRQQSFSARHGLRNRFV